MMRRARSFGFIGLMLLGSTPAGASFHATPGGNLWICQNKAQVEARKYVDKQVKAVAACLNTLSREIVGKNLPATAPAIAAPTCVSQFRKLYDTRATPHRRARRALRVRTDAEAVRVSLERVAEMEEFWRFMGRSRGKLKPGSIAAP